MVTDTTDETAAIGRLLEARWQAQITDAAATLAHSNYYAAVRAAHEAGLTWQQIGTELGVHLTRARALALKAKPEGS